MMNEKNQAGRRKKLLLLALGLLMAFMLLFTLVARAASAFTTTRVTVENPAARRIDHTVQGTGVTEKNRELAVLAQENLMVETVFVSQGESVSAGTVLAQLSMGSIEEELRLQEEELELLKLQLASAQENESQASNQRQLALQRATEDYQRTCREQEDALEAARSRYQETADALERCRQELAAAGAGSASGAGGTGPEGTGNTGGSSDPDGAGNAGGATGPEGGASPEGTGNAGGAQAQDLQAKLEQLEQELREAQTALSAAEQNKADACRSAARTLEDARQKSAADYSARITQISITQKERVMEELKQVQQAQGQVLAPVDGVITQVYLAVGQKTTDTAAFTMADLSSGLRYVAEISKEDAAYVSVGDPVTLTAGGKEYKDLTVFSMEETEEETVQVTVMVPTGGISMGEYAQMEVVKRSQEYAVTLPMTAIHTENGKSYVYVMEEKETVLGGRYAARSVEVNVAEQNGQFAALTEGTVSGDTPVITSSDNYLKAGDTVRLQEE